MNHGKRTVELRSAVIAAVVAAVVASVVSGPMPERAVDRVAHWSQASVAYVKGERGKRGPRGKRGKTGKRGRTGARGPAGPQGPPGVQSLVAASAVTPVTLGSGETGIALATCPSGTRVIWGGFNTGSATDVQVQSTLISTRGDSHLVQATNDSNAPATVTASALCASVALNRGFGNVLP